MSQLRTTEMLTRRHENLVICAVANVGEYLAVLTSRKACERPYIVTLKMTTVMADTCRPCPIPTHLAKVLRRHQRNA